MTPSYAARGRIGALVRASRYPAETLTVAATAGFRRRFEREVDPDGLLDPEDRQRRADLAFRAHMARLALRSASARASKRGPRDLAAPRAPVDESTALKKIATGLASVATEPATTPALLDEALPNDRPAT